MRCRSSTGSPTAGIAAVWCHWDVGPVKLPGRRDSVTGGGEGD